MDIRDLPEYTEPLAPPSTQRSWDLPLEVVTPLYGGGSRTREVDEATPVRVSAIRGQLRFWWRALFGGEFLDSRKLYARERCLFGGIGDDPTEIIRSPLTLDVRNLVRTAIQDEDVNPQDKDSYVLWPARATSTGDPPAQRWREGLRFRLVARLGPVSEMNQATAQREIEHALRAWLLFGGIGGRTRRGCGSLALADEQARAYWLPVDDEIATIAAWLAPNPTCDSSYPVLAGATLHVGQPMPALQAWRTAFGWLKDFRQGAPNALDTAQSGDFARQRPSLAKGNAGRPGRSRWPEADCARRELRARDHPVLIGNASDCWPRAQFGLPIQMQFQKKDRSNNYFANRPPPNLELKWSDGTDIKQRLASPLIVKPMQRRDGSFAPLALWLQRTLPAQAEVGISGRDDAHLRAGALITDMPEDPLFLPLTGKRSVEEAFSDWLTGTRRTLRGGRL